MENNKILTVDIIPKGYYWAAVEPDGTAYAFKEMPRLSVDYNSWESNEGSGHVIIGKNFDTSNWKKSLICFDLDFKVFFDDLTVDDIPDGYNYIAIDSFSSVYAYINEPVKNYDYWEKMGEEICKQIGLHLGEFDWEDSLVSRVSDPKFKTLTEVDIPEGFKYAVITKAGTAVATVVAPRLTKWGWDFREGELKVIGEGYDFTDWQNSFISREAEQKLQLKQLTADDIPERYNYAAVSTSGVAYVYENEPTINENIKHWSPNGRYEVIGNGYDVTDWRNSLVCREPKKLKTLTVDDIPDGFYYAAIDGNGDAIAYEKEPYLHSTTEWWCKDTDDTNNILIGKGYDSTSWRKSLIKKAKVLKISDIPQGYNYAAVDSCGTAFAFRSKPVPHNTGSYFISDEEDSIEIEGYFDASDWKNSLVSREVEQKSELEKLTVADIPDGYNYAAIDSDSYAYAYKYKPKLDKDDTYWYYEDFDDPVELGRGYNNTDWKNSLVSKEGATFNGVISSFDYSKFNNVSFFDYGKLNSNSFPINNRMEKPITEISNLSSKFSSFDTTFLKVAEVIAERSKSTRLKVGAVLVKDKRIISTGYNGLVSGVEPDVLEDENGVTKKEVIHAELNCIISCARNGISCEGATLYLTHSPCEACAALIAQSGIKKVIFKEYYRDLSGIDKLKFYGVKII